MLKAKKIFPFHLDRAAGRYCNYRHSCGDAHARFAAGKKHGEGVKLSQQHCSAF